MEEREVSSSAERPTDDDMTLYNLEAALRVSEVRGHETRQSGHEGPFKHTRTKRCRCPSTRHCHTIPAPFPGLGTTLSNKALAASCRGTLG